MERRAMWSRRMQIVKRFSNGENLLDIGTGDGHFMDVAAKEGYSCQGTEFSNAGKQRAEKRGFLIHFGQLNELHLPSSSYDVITMWHVLEHVPNPGDVLREIWRLLKPGGIVVIAVPNEENTLLRWRLRKTPMNPLGNHEDAWGNEIHLTHFQPNTMRRSLEICGYRLMFFGVDDIYKQRTVRNLSVVWLQKLLSYLSGWHFSMAMLAVAKKPC